MAVLAPIPSASERTAATVKPGVAAQAAKAVTEIAGGTFEPGHAAAVANVFLGLGDAAEFAEGGGARGGGVHALAAKFLFLHGEVNSDLFVQLAVQAAAAKESAKALEERAWIRPIRRGAGSAA